MNYDDVQQVLTGHDSPETAFVQDDYPYGRHRTERRVWVETAAKGSKRGQQRFMAQTHNPKTGRWNNPKKSTYSDIIVLYLDSNQHVKQAVLTTWDSAEKIAAFLDVFGEYLTTHQQDGIRYLDAVQRVSKRVTWTIREPGDNSPEQTPEQQARILNAMLVQELRQPSQQPILG